MASKRAVQLLTQRCNAPSVIGRDVSMRLGMHAARAMSTASRSRVLCVGAGSRVRGVRKEQGVVPQRRWDSSTAASSEGTGRMYDFDDIRALISSPTPTRLLIDVREPHEFAVASIPTALNIPISSQPDALLLDEEDFADRFGFDKPGKDVEVVFFCKAGVRSRAAAGVARGAGYGRVGEYRGSWVDWVGRGGEESR